MPTPRLIVALTAFLTTALPLLLAQAPPAEWSQNLLPKGEARTVAAEPVAILQPGDAELPARHEMRLTASRTAGTGLLLVTLRDGSGQLVRLFSKVPAPNAKVTLCWTIDDGKVAAGDGTALVTLARLDTTTATAAWTARANDATYRLDDLRWRELPRAKAGKTEAPRPATGGKPDLMSRLAQRERWTGELSTDRGKPQDCTIVILEQSSARLVFRLENERGGWFRFECSIENGKPKVQHVTHTRRAGGGPRAVISNEKGQGRLVGDRFEFDFSYTCRINGAVNTSTGRVSVELPPVG